MCSTSRASHYLHQGYSGFVAYVMDTRDMGTMTVHDVSIMRDYPDVFPKDFAGVPPERQVEFRIDLVPGAPPIGKEPYWLAPPEMKELSTQLHELLDKGFIRPSSFPWASLIFVCEEGRVSSCVYRLSRVE